MIIYLAGAQIFNRKVGIYAALLVALSPVHIYFSQEARAYSLFFALTLLSMYFYSRLIKVASKRVIAGYIISTSFLLYSHFYALLIILVQNLHLIVVKRDEFSREAKAWFLIQFVLFILYAPWIIQLPGIVSNNSHSWISRPSFLQLTYIIYNFFSGTVFSFYGLFLTMICSLLVLRYKGKSDLLFLLWILVPLLVPFTYSLLFTPIFIPKYIFFISFPLSLIASQSLSRIRPGIRPLLISAVIILSVAAMLVQQNKTTKDPWDKAALYIEASDQRDDKVIILNSYEILPFSYYFDKDCFDSSDIYECSYGKGVYPSDSLEDVKRIDEERFWLILSRGAYNPEVRDIRDYISDNYTETDSSEYILNPNHVFINKLYKYFEGRGLIHLESNKIIIAHFQKR